MLTAGQNSANATLLLKHHLWYAKSLAKAAGDERGTGTRIYPHCQIDWILN
jgi:hypothetical protein